MSANSSLRSPVILIVEDHRAVRQALRELVHLAFGVVEVLEAATVAEALSAVEARTVDVVLMDIRLPGVDGLTGTRRLLACSPRSAVLVVSNFDDPFHRYAAGRAGAKGFVSKRTLGRDLVPAIETLLAAVSARASTPDRAQAQAAGQDGPGFGLGGAFATPPAGTI